MKTTYYLSFLMLCVSFSVFAQQKKNLNKIIDELIPHIAVVNIGNTNEKEHFVKYLNFLKKVEDLKRLKGSIEFGFVGNEVDNSNLYTINTGMKANYGGYPLEVEATTNIQTQVTNGKFEENLSSLDISMDYHPFNNLTHETYVFVMRTKNKFLGINQRYEIGGGYVFNFYSGKEVDGKGKSLTSKGKDLIKKLNDNHKVYSSTTRRQPKAKRDKIKDVLNRHFRRNGQSLDADKYDTIYNSKVEQQKSIIKNFSKHRAALLVGFNYELEQTQDSLTLFNKDLDSTFNKTFEATNLFRFVIAPKYTLKGDKFKWSNVIFFKIGLLNLVDDIVIPDETISNQLVTDKRADYWMDLKTSFEFKISEQLSFVSTLNYVYDNAPKRIYFDDAEGIPRIAEAEQSFTGINFTLKYQF